MSNVSLPVINIQGAPQSPNRKQNKSRTKYPKKSPKRSPSKSPIPSSRRSSNRHCNDSIYSNCSPAYKSPNRNSSTNNTQNVVNQSTDKALLSANNNSSFSSNLNSLSNMRPKSSRKSPSSLSISRNKSPSSSQRGSSSNKKSTNSNINQRSIEQNDYNYHSESKSSKKSKNLKCIRGGDRQAIQNWSKNAYQLNEEQKVNVSRAKSRSKSRSKSKSSKKIVIRNEMRQSIPNIRNQEVIFNKDEELKNLERQTLSNNDLIKGYIFILKKSIQASKTYTINSYPSETNDSISFSINENLTMLLSLSFNPSSSLCLSLSPLCCYLPCQEELRLLIPHVKKLILLSNGFDTKSSRQPQEDCWLKEMIIKINVAINLSQIEIEAEVFNFWKSILRVERLRGRGIQVCIREWLLTSRNAIQDLFYQSSYFNFCIEDWVLDREKNVIGNLYFIKKMITLEYSKLNNYFIQQACELLFESIRQPLNIRIIDRDNNCCFSQFDLFDSEEKDRRINMEYDEIVECLINFYDNNEPENNTIEFLYHKIIFEYCTRDRDEIDINNNTCAISFMNEIKNQHQSNCKDKIKVIQNNQNYKFSAKIENETISSAHLGFLYVLLANTNKITFSNCILTLNTGNNFTLLKPMLLSDTNDLILDKCEYREFYLDRESENNNVNFVSVKPVESDLSKNLFKFLTQTKQIDSLKSIRIVDNTCSLGMDFKNLINQDYPDITVIHDYCRDRPLINTKFIKYKFTDEQKIEQKFTDTQSTDKSFQLSNGHVAVLHPYNKYQSGKRKFIFGEKVTMNKFKANTQSCSSYDWEKKSIKELFSKSYYHCTATFEKLEETKNQAQNLTSFEAKCWNIEETPEEDILMKDHCDSNLQQTKNNLTFSYIADSMIKEKPDQWVFSASLKNKVVQIKCADINIHLDYEEIFLNSFFIQCSRLKLINFCCCTKNTLDALNSAMNAPLQSNTKYCFEQVEFETSQHLCSRNEDLTNLKSEFVSSVKEKFTILQNDCFENLKKNL